MLKVAGKNIKGKLCPVKQLFHGKHVCNNISLLFSIMEIEMR